MQSVRHLRQWVILLLLYQVLQLAEAPSKKLSVRAFVDLTLLMNKSMTQLSICFRRWVLAAQHSLIERQSWLLLKICPQLQHAKKYLMLLLAIPLRLSYLLSRAWYSLNTHSLQMHLTIGRIFLASSIMLAI